MNAYLKNYAKLKMGKITHVLAVKRHVFSHIAYWRWRRVFLFRSFFVDLNKGINPHVVIVGQSGSGKSNACKMLLSQLAAQGSAIAIIDPHNEYVGFAKDINAKVHDAGLEAVNLLDMRGSAKEKAGELSNMLRVRLRLGFRQYNELYKLLLYTYTICEKEAKQANMRELLYSLQVFKKNASGCRAFNARIARKQAYAHKQRR